MYRFCKQPDIPDSSPDMLTFPLEFGPFQFTMENFVRSYTRKRVTKEDLIEVINEVNSSIKRQAESFKVWDYVAMLFLILINGGTLACLITLKMNDHRSFCDKVIFCFCWNGN